MFNTIMFNDIYRNIRYGITDCQTIIDLLAAGNRTAYAGIEGRQIVLASLLASKIAFNGSEVSELVILEADGARNFGFSIDRLSAKADLNVSLDAKVGD